MAKGDAGDRLKALSIGLAVAAPMLIVGAPAPANPAHGHHSPALPTEGAVTAQDSGLGHEAETGTASVYARQHLGKPTASGQRFDERKLTAASKTLPLRSKAKVTNLETGRSVDVTITDRGPYAKHRIIDLSSAAAKKIGIAKKEGTAPVEVKPAGSGSTIAAAPTGE